MKTKRIFAILLISLFLISFTSALYWSGGGSGGGGGGGGGNGTNVFDQWLNTTSNVTFNYVKTSTLDTQGDLLSNGGGSPSINWSRRILYDGLSAESLDWSQLPLISYKSFIPFSNNSFDLGESAHQWGNGYFGTEVYIGGKSVSSWLYNQTTASITILNSTYGKYWYNMTTAGSSPLNIFNQNLNTTNNVTFNNITVSTDMTVGNISVRQWLYNQTYTGGTFNATYAIWAYNQTTAAITILNSTYGKYWYNMTGASAALTNIFDQWLNTSSNVQFGNITSTGNLTVKGNSTFSSNVGIGISNPQVALEILNTSTMFNSVQLKISDGEANTTFRSIDSGGITLLDIDPIPYSGLNPGNNSLVRIWRSVNTNGSKQLQLFRGDNTTNIDAQIGVNGSTSYFQFGGGFLGIGTNAPTRLLDVRGAGNFSSTVYINNGTDISNFVATLSNVSFNYINFTGDLYSNDSFFYFNGSSHQFNIGLKTLSSLVTPIVVNGNNNNYYEINIQNFNESMNASSDFTATNNLGDTSDYYVNLGINSGGFSYNNWTINRGNDSYLYAQNGSLAVGTSSVGQNLTFFTGGTLYNNERMRITGTGLVGIGTNTTYPPSQLLDVRGNINVSNDIFVGNVTSLKTWAYNQTTPAIKNIFNQNLNTTNVVTHANVTASQLIQLNAITGTLGACGATQNGSFSRNQTGLYFCNTTAIWVQLKF